MVKKQPDQPPGRPFIERKDFINTPFAQRFQGRVIQAWKQQAWHVIAAVPRSGKSWSLDDLNERSGARKEANGRTYMPLLIARSPKNQTTEQALCLAMARAFGVIPTAMRGTYLHSWLLDECVRAQVECLIYDDSQDLSLAHLRYIKLFTDELEAFPYRRKVGLCLVSATNGQTFPLKETFDRPETLWVQFRGRLDTEDPYCMVYGHTQAEVRKVLATFEMLYKDQFPDLTLRKLSKAIYEVLTHPTLDPLSSKRVVMHDLSEFVRLCLKRAAKAGATNINKAIMGEVADLMTLRRDEVTNVDGLPPEDEGTLDEGAG